MYFSNRLAVASCAALLCLGLAIAADRPPAPRVIEEIVAKVNGEIITRGELTRQRAAIRAEGEKQGLIGAALDQAVDKAAADALREQIDQLLLVQKAKDLNINVDSDVNKQIAEIQRQSGLADPDKFHDWVHEKSGETFEDFKLQMKNKSLVQRVIGEEVYRNVSIPKAEMQKYYEEHKKEFVREDMVSVREILVSVGDGSPAKTAAAEKKAKELADRAKKGEKFADLARQYSDAETAKDDGMLPPYKKGEMNKTLEGLLFTHDKGFVTDPILIPKVGYEIMKLEDRSVAGQASFEEAQGEINNRLAAPKVEPKLRDLLTQLREQAFLQIKPGFVDSGAAPGKDTSWKDPAQLKPQTTTKEAVANRRRMKKFLKVVPYGRTGVKDPGEAAPDTTTPVSAKPVQNADSSPSK